ncbi:MAG: hypothetical protein OXC67_11580 [Flavobacteriaceae bacterium]|nr:hypothetical protein [Flavobacteriaceae bacterium]
MDKENKFRTEASFSKKEMRRLIRGVIWVLVGLAFVILLFQKVNVFAKLLGVLLWFGIASPLTPILTRRFGLRNPITDEKVRVLEQTNYLLIIIALILWCLF